MRMIVPGRLPGLNEFINANRSNKHAGAKMKREAEEIISLYIPRWQTYEEPVVVKFYFYEPNAKRDIDNVSSFFAKVCLDSLVRKKVLRNDSQAYVKGLEYRFFVDKDNPRIVVDIHPWEVEK